MIKNGFYCGLSLIILGAVISACAPQMVKERELGEITAARKVLIAMQQSEFKEAVISGVVDALEREGCFVNVINSDKLSRSRTEDYEAVVVLDSFKAWRLNKHVRKFLKNVHDGEKHKIIFVVTANFQGLVPDIVGVDTITSASRMEKADVVTGEIIEKVRAIVTSVSEDRPCRE